MSTSLLYHNHSVRGVRYLRTEYSGGKTTFYATIADSKLQCSSCGSPSVVRSGGVWRTFHLLPTGDRSNLLRLYIPRVKCHDCGRVRQVELLFAEHRRSYSRTLGRFVIRLAALMPLTQVAELCGIGWDTVKQIHKEGLRKRFRHIRLKDVRYMAIDEVCIGRPRRFLTIVMDLESGEILHIGRGKGSRGLKGFWKRLRLSGARIRAVSTDMASGYMSWVAEHLPDAALVLDHFHLVKYMNDKLTQLRRQLWRKAKQAEKDEEKEVLKGIRWLLLTSRKKLQRKAKATGNDEALLELDAALDLNKPLYSAYYLKEELAKLWKQDSKAKGERYLRNWLTKAKESGVDLLRKAAEWLEERIENILLWFDHKISSGKLEAFNGNIRRLMKNTCGMRDQEYMFLRIRNLMYAKT